MPATAGYGTIGEREDFRTSHASASPAPGLCAALGRPCGSIQTVVDKSPQPPDWLQADARQVYGSDPEDYDAARPDYPDRVYQLLESRCGIAPGTEVLEIGPGTGRVTRRLLAL